MSYPFTILFLFFCVESKKILNIYYAVYIYIVPILPNIAFTNINILHTYDNL